MSKVFTREQLEAIKELINVIGLFGSCGKSTWRKEKVIPKLTALGVPPEGIFNPQVEVWTDECAALEKLHFIKDRFLFFVVLGTETSHGTLTELGFALAQCQRTGQHLTVVVEDFVPMTCDESASEEVKALIAKINDDAIRDRKLCLHRAEDCGLKIYRTIDEGLKALVMDAIDEDYAELINEVQHVFKTN